MAADQSAICRGPPAAISRISSDSHSGQQAMVSISLSSSVSEPSGDEVVQHFQRAHHLAVRDLQANAAQ